MGETRKMIEQEGSSAPRLSRLPRARDPRFIRVTDARISATIVQDARRERRRPFWRTGGGGGGDDGDGDDDGSDGEDEDEDDVARGIFCTLTGGAASEQSPQQAPSPSHAVCERTDQPLKRHVTTVRLRRGDGAALPPRASRRAGTPRGRTKMYEKPAIVAVTRERARTGAREGGSGHAETRRKEEGEETRARRGEQEYGGYGERISTREEEGRERDGARLNDTRTERKTDGRFDGGGLLFTWGTSLINSTFRKRVVKRKKGKRRMKSSATYVTA